MDKKIILSVLALSLVAIVVGLSIPVAPPPSQQSLPWQIETNAQGVTRVFALSPGESSLLAAERRFAAEAEVSLFRTADKTVIEAYFDKVTLGGLSARVVLVLQLPPERVAAMYQRGTRVSRLGDGTQKVTLAAADLAELRDATIASLTYLPRVTLDAESVEKRFGPAPQRLQEAATGTRHWQYPQRGLDVALDAHGQAVFQYLPPAQFGQLSAPLLEQRVVEAQQHNNN
jgi:hypothetical protein